MFAIYKRTLREQVVSTSMMVVVLILLAFYLTQIFRIAIANSGIGEFINALPDFLLAFVGGAEGFSVPGGFLNAEFFTLIGPVIITAFAVVRGLNVIAGEEANGTLEQLLAHPISRSTVYISKWFGIVTALIVLAVVFWIALMIAAPIAQITINPGLVAQALVSWSLFGISVMSLTLAIGASSGSKIVAVGVAVGTVLIGYLINTFRLLVEFINDLRFISIYYYYNGNTVIANGLLWWHVLILVGFTVVILAIGVFVFGRRDLK